MKLERNCKHHDVGEEATLNFRENIYIPGQNLLDNISAVYSSFRII